MDGRTYSPTRIAISAILVVAAAMLLVAAALAGPTRSAAASGPAAAGKVGGTLRVNLSTTDVQYTPTRRWSTSRPDGRSSTPRP